MRNMRHCVVITICLLFLTGCASNSILVDEATISRFEEAITAIQSNQGEVALVILEELQRSGYTTINVWSALAHAYQQNGQPIQAVAIAYKLLAHSPRISSIPTLFDTIYIEIEGERQPSIWTIYLLWQHIGFITLNEHLSTLLFLSMFLLIVLFINYKKRIPQGILIALLFIHFVILLSYTLRLYLETIHPIAIYTDSTPLPVHGSPTEDAPKLFEILPGTLFYIDRVDEGEWLKVVTYYGRHGWIMTNQFELLRRFDVYSQ